MRHRHALHGWIAAGLATALLSTGIAASDGAPDLAVREDHGVYFVTARFHVQQPAKAVWNVLTDYEQIPRFMPQIKTSIVVERAPGHAVVQQEADSRFMMFSKRVFLLLDITEAGETLTFRDRSARSFSRYEGTWCVREENGATNVEYELTADPDFDVPDFLVKRLLKRDAGQTVDQLRAELAARSAIASSRSRE
jgi:ribosome-associated toxin RatA of RatAB toxin-antitoxin module